MGMRKLFQKAAVTALKVAGDITQQATYKESIDDGFGNVVKQQSSCRIIYDKFTDAEAERYSFGSLIQLKDKKGLVSQLSVSIPIRAQQKLVDATGTEYTIVAKEMDAADALYILLLRKV